MSEQAPRNRRERRDRRKVEKTPAVRGWKRAMKGVHAPAQIMNLNGGRRGS